MRELKVHYSNNKHSCPCWQQWDKYIFIYAKDKVHINADSSSADTRHATHTLWFSPCWHQSDKNKFVDKPHEFICLHTRQIQILQNSISNSMSLPTSKTIFVHKTWSFLAVLKSVSSLAMKLMQFHVSAYPTTSINTDDNTPASHSVYGTS